MGDSRILQVKSKVMIIGFIVLFVLFVLFALFVWCLCRIGKKEVPSNLPYNLQIECYTDVQEADAPSLPQSSLCQ